MDDQGLFDDDPVLSRRERLRAQREAAHRAPTRVGLRFTAAATVVVGLLVWLAVSWLTSSPSASEQLPADPTLLEEPGTDGGGTEGTSGVAPSAAPETDESSGEGAASPSGKTASPVPVVVHVAGAVEDPGVVELQSGDRVRDAVAAAGGMTDEAAAEGINLAAEAVDGGYLHVPTVEELESGEVPAAPADPGGGGAAGDAGGTEGGDVSSAPVDVNRADAETLQRLPGIGPALAGRIIEHRNAAGPFESLEDLAGVSGIGPSTLEDVEDQVTW